MEQSFGLIAERLNILDTSIKQKPSVTYGTVSSVSTFASVVIDGDTDPTPCTMAVGCESGDRVVIIKRGTTYLLIGNITNPFHTRPGFGVAGVVLAFSGTTVPAGYLLCDGSAKSRTTYAELFSAIGTTYGGSGSNFNLPNYQGQAIISYM